MLMQSDSAEIPTGFPFVLTRTSVNEADVPSATNAIVLSPDLHYLDDGDVIRITPPLRISSIYRRRANTNSLLVTERCNSFCVMCSQPPRDIDDSHLVPELIKAIPLFDRGTKEIGITGGEPTLLGDQLFDLIGALKSYLPDTGIHILSNGRRFQDLALAQRIASMRHPNMMLGIPLYSDVAAIHDFVVQADGAFDETIRGILNLKRCGVRVEIRIVIHSGTYERLPSLAQFLARNLQFVDQVVLMGLEVTGFAKANIKSLWIDPIEYQQQLLEAVQILEQGKIKTAIYNHQLCVLHPSARRFAVSSISDWKKEYIAECQDCDLRNECGGFFGTSHGRRSEHIQPIRLRGVHAA
jgi:His-Xaa-Ser system radical SAM maturase HxsC